MKISCILCCCLSHSDIIGIITIVVLGATVAVAVVTVFILKKGNDNNVQINRLMSAENTIIKQLEFQNNILQEISFSIQNDPYNGRKAIGKLYGLLNEIYYRMQAPDDKGKNDMDGEERRIKESFEQLYKDYGSQFGNYYKNLYLLIDYIDNVEIDGFQRDYYIDLVKAQLSKDEILLLAYDCIWIQDKPKGKNFIEFAKKYNLLAALEKNALIESSSSVKHEDIFKTRYGIVFK